MLFTLSYFILLGNLRLLIAASQSDGFLANKKKLGITNFVLEKRRVENYPDFEKSTLVPGHGLRDFYFKNTEDESSHNFNLSP